MKHFKTFKSWWLLCTWVCGISLSGAGIYNAVVAEDTIAPTSGSLGTEGSAPRQAVHGTSAVGNTTLAGIGDCLQSL